MIEVSQEFKQALLNDNRQWVEEATITLADGTVLEITNANIWGGKFDIEDAVCGDNSFGALGATVVNKATLVINNIYDDFSEYDFTNATVEMRVGLELTTKEMLNKGIYTVDEAKYDGSLITLECLDNMIKFDRPYSVSTLQYPATLLQIVSDACSACGVTLSTHTFPHYTFSVAYKPESDALTFREVVGWCAEIAGCFARINTNGALELKWYDDNVLKQQSSDLDGGVFDNGSPKYTSGDNADGGHFNPWNVGYVADSNSFGGQSYFHSIYSIYHANIAVDQTVITGVQITVKKETEEDGRVLVDYRYGTEGNLVKIENNDFITEENVATILEWLGRQLTGFSYRKAEIQHASDPSIEAGDVAVIHPRKGNTYAIIVTRTNFSCGSSQKTVSSAETPVRNSATRYTEAAKAYVDAINAIQKESLKREFDVAELTLKLANSSGMYTTEEAGTSGTIFYMHDKPSLDESTVIWKMNSQAWGVSTDGGETWNAGMTVDGDTIVRILEAKKISADIINSGTLTIGGRDNQSGLIELLDSANKSIGRLGNDGFKLINGNTNLHIKDASLNWYANNTPKGSLNLSVESPYGSQVNLYSYDHNLIVGSRKGGVYIDAYGTYGPAIMSAEDNYYGVKKIEYSKNGTSNWYINFVPFSGKTYCVAVTPVSDKNLKKNIKETEADGLEQINKIEHVSFDLKDGGHSDCGYIAQQLQEINRGFVAETKSEDDGESTLFVVDHEILAVATKAIQELDEKNRRLEERVAKLEKLVEDLIARE